jgi:hypothetical protein
MATSDEEPQPDGDPLDPTLAKLFAVAPPDDALDRFNAPETCALHEAAHAVLGVMRGYTLCGLCLCGNQADRTWMTLPALPPSVDDQLLVEVAGDAVELEFELATPDTLAGTDQARATALIGEDAPDLHERIDDARRLARHEVSMHEEAVRALGERLLEKRLITGAEAAEVLRPLLPDIEIEVGELDHDCCLPDDDATGA